MLVKKQTGNIEEFDSSKIVKAVKGAAKTAKYVIEEMTLSNIVTYVVGKCSQMTEPVETGIIKNAVEEALMLYNLFEVEKVFHDECKRREKERYKKFQVVREMKVKLEASKIENQNANVDENSFGGRIGEADSVFLKNYALDYMIDPVLSKLHRTWHFYIHDLDRWAIAMHNCLTYPIDQIIKGASIKIPKALREAGCVSTFCQLVMVHLQSQSMCQFGGVSLSHLDWSLVPFVRKSFWNYFKRVLKVYAELEGVVIEMPVKKEDRTEVSITDPIYQSSDILKKVYKCALDSTIEEINQSLEGLLHNANTLQSRSGNQLPFTSVNYGTCTTKEGQLVIEGILNAWEEGIGELHLTPIFPCGIFQLMDGVNTKKGDPNYYLFRRALEVLPKRDYPNFANCDWHVDRAGFEKSQHIKQNVLEGLEKDLWWKLVKLPASIHETLGFKINSNGTFTMNDYPQPFEVMSTMGCRTYNGFDINFTEEYFLERVLKPTIENGELPRTQLWSGNQKDGRGNIAPNTVLMPFLAMEAKKKAKNNPEYVVEYFMDLLKKTISASKDELINRFNWIAAQSADVAKYMYVENVTMLGYVPEEGIKSALKHGTLAIGQIGMAETLEILIGCDHTDPKGMALARKIEEVFNTKCAEYKERYKLNFGVYFTPAENLCYTSMKAFRAKYKRVENVTVYTDDKGVEHEKEFFTNSIHVPVYKKMPISQKFLIESMLAGYSNAGCITYGEVDAEVAKNVDALEQIILYGKALGLPYIALNFQINECTRCGSTDIDTEKKVCRKCGAVEAFINWLRRITGYLNGNYLKSFNWGKQKETEARVDHDFVFIKDKDVEAFKKLMESYGVTFENR